MADTAIGIAEFPCRDAAPRQLTLRRQVLVVLGAALGIGCGAGPIVFSAAGIFLKPMAASFDWSRADASVLTTMCLVGTVICAPCIGYIAGRLGYGKVIAFSILLFALALLALSVAPPSHAYIITVGLLMGIVGTATSSPGYIAVISRLFDHRLGMALGLAALGGGVGVTVVPMVAAKLLEHMDWRQAYACFAGICLVLGFVAHQLIFRTLDTSAAGLGRGKTEKDATAVGDAGEGLSFGLAIKSYRFWLIGVAALIVTLSATGMSIHLVSYATDRGITPAIAARIAGSLGLGIMLARVGVGLILDRIFAPLLACGVYLCGAAGFYLLSTNTIESPWIITFAAILVGISHGGEGDIVPYLARKYFGVRAIGSIFGALFSISVIGSALGTYAYGWSFDVFKSYAPILQVSALLSCVCGLAILTLGRYPYASGEEKQ